MMTNSRRIRAADVAVGYAADDGGRGIAYASIGTGTSRALVRLTFSAAVLPGLDGLEAGYAAVAVVAAHLKARGFARARLRVADERIVADLNGAGSPPRALAMAYVKVRCLLHALGSVRLEAAAPVEVRDLAARAQAEVRLHAAA